MAKPLTEAQFKVLRRATRRERGNICPIIDVRIFAAAEMAVIYALLRKGLIDSDRIPFITDAGRRAVEEHQL